MLYSIHHCGKVGHVEDIAVSQSHQGKGLGKKIIAAMDAMAPDLGCYKTLLDCSEKNRGFYEKCGYKWKEHHMSRYYLDVCDAYPPSASWADSSSRRPPIGNKL